MEPSVATRLHVEADLAPGATLGLDHARSHYLRSVLRLAPGARLALFNGRDGEWLARLEGLGKGWASVAIGERLRAQESEDDLWLCFAPIKRARIDFLAEKATELGVSVLQPVTTRHTAVSRVNVDRLAANAREAAEQCERLTLPEVREPLDLGRLLADWPEDRRLLVCAERGQVKPVGAILAEAAGRDEGAPSPWAILTGPEGGFAERELDLLAAHPATLFAGLGPRILKADTAAIAALACWQAALGDREGRPAFRTRPPDS